MRSTLAFFVLLLSSVALVASEPQNTAQLHRRHHHHGGHHEKSKKAAKARGLKSHHKHKARKACAAHKTSTKKVAATPSSPAPASAASDTDSDASSGGSTASNATTVDNAASKVVSAALSAITGFLSKPNSGIGSWYRASSSSDSTNGHSWCYFPYQDSSPVFAPSYNTMVNNFGGDPIAAGKAYCGLEAIVTNPTNGKSMTLYIGDAFDDQWVRTPNSIDIMTDAFNQLFGQSTTDKNNVIQGVQWTLTGNRSPQYTFNGPGN